MTATDTSLAVGWHSSPTVPSKTVSFKESSIQNPPMMEKRVKESCKRFDTGAGLRSGVGEAAGRGGAGLGPVLRGGIVSTYSSDAYILPGIQQYTTVHSMGTGGWSMGGMLDDWIGILKAEDRKCLPLMQYLCLYYDARRPYVVCGDASAVVYQVPGTRYLVYSYCTHSGFALQRNVSRPTSYVPGTEAAISHPRKGETPTPGKDRPGFFI